MLNLSMIIPYSIIIRIKIGIITFEGRFNYNFEIPTEIIDFEIIYRFVTRIRKITSSGQRFQSNIPSSNSVFDV